MYLNHFISHKGGKRLHLWLSNIQASVLKKAAAVFKDKLILSTGFTSQLASLKKPILILRDKPERPEVVDAGIGEVVGTDRDEIYHRASSLISNPKALTHISQSQNPLGNGTAAKKIVKIIFDQL